jgi:tRNA pseudouridine32 synthase / 23S rRNA pseudouridine746 synthase
VEILYEDSDLLAINKPSGLLSIPDGYQFRLPTVKSVLEPEFGRLWIIHRLDKETSGVLLIARNQAAHKKLNIVFQERKVNKNYHAIVYGEYPDVDSTIDLPLRKNGDREHRTIIDLAVGKPALTYVKNLSSGALISLVSAQPKTGYTHQIRAHLSALGFPIVGDTLYTRKGTGANKSIRIPFPRVALHAFEISFIHPLVDKMISINAPYPPDFQNLLLEYLNQNPGN